MKEVKLTLIKTPEGISATNETESKVSFFEDDEESRKAFVLFMVDEFINKEVDGGKKYR